MSTSYISSSTRASGPPEGGAPEGGSPEARRARVEWHLVAYQLRQNPLLLVGIVVLLFFLLAGIFAEPLAPYPPKGAAAQNMTKLRQPPDAENLFGTDRLGRDVFSRLLYGTRLTIPSGFLVILFGSIIGSVIGAIAGYLGGSWDELLMRVTELFMAFPTIILAMAIAAALGPSITNAIIALTIAWWPFYARMMRGLVLSVKPNDFVEAAQSIGASQPYILFRTIVPNAIAPIIVMMTLDIGSAILVFAGLSFLGLGPEPTVPEWGQMVANGIDNFDAWWMWFYPGMAIATLVMALNFIGDGVRDITDPRLRKK